MELGYIILLIILLLIILHGNLTVCIKPGYITAGFKILL